MHRLRRFAFPAGLALVCVSLAMAGEPARQALRYDRDMLVQEPWRVFTAHLVHLGWSHLALNLSGLVLIWALVGAHMSPVRWLVVFLVTSLGVSGGLWLFDPSLQWYVGLSGVLHGILVAGALAGWSRYPKESLGILVLVIGKLIWEHWAGALPGSEYSTGGPVIVDAHLYGAVTGALAAVLLGEAPAASPQTDDY